MRLALWILAVLAVLGCDRDRETTARGPTSVTDPEQLPQGAPAVPTSTPPEIDVAPRQAPALAVGDRLAPVPSRAADGTVDCGACRLGQVPRLLVVGSIDALARAEIWRDLDAIARLYADNGLAALAIVVTREGDTTKPATDPSLSATQIEEVRKRGRIAMPVEIATDTAALVGVADDPSVVLVDGGDIVRFVGGAGSHWRDLDLAIGSLLAAE
jgi:hypothetical protein